MGMWSGLRAGVLAVAAVVMTQGCAFRLIKRDKQIVYQAAKDGVPEQRLNVFYPQRHRAQHDRPVFIFVHGGDWNAGRKELYNFLGGRLARKGVVAVVIDYPLSPTFRYDQMAAAVAASVAWTRGHITVYGGDTSRIFLGGHSAGGHLSALVGLDTGYTAALGLHRPVRGLIMIDAAGLDMYDYLKAGHLSESTYRQTFTQDQSEWKRATPLYHLHAGQPPFLILVGGRTYPSIASSNVKFLKELRPIQPDVPHYLLRRRRHVPMITQFLWSYNRYYRVLTDFMRR